MKAVCDWCCSIITAPNHYNPLQHAIFCCQHCKEKDWLFRKWQNETYLNHLARKYKGGDFGSQT